MVVCFFFRTPHPGLTLDSLEDVLNWEFQRGEAVGYLVDSGLVLLRVRERLLLESALHVTLKVNRGASMLRLWLYSVIAAIERWIDGAFH